MSRTKKPFLRWVGEALLIFLSILGAFYVDNYREQKAKETTYLKHLADFRFDLEKTTGSMNFELNDQGDANQQSGYLPKLLQSADSLNTLVKSKNPNNLTPILSIVEQLDDRISKWIFSSPHFDRLTLDYYYFVRNPELKSNITTHQRDHLHRQQSKEAVNGLVDKLTDLLIDVNFERPDVRTNRALVFNNKVANTTERLLTAYRVLLQTTELNQERDALLLKEIENEKALW